MFHRSPNQSSILPIVIGALAVLIFASAVRASAGLSAQNENRGALYNTIQAKENFRLGVNAFNYGFYNRAIVAFEQSLSFQPQNIDTIFWLGRSYYANGYLGLGLEQWKQLIDQNQAKASLKSFHNALDYRFRGVAALQKMEPYSQFMKLEANKQGINRSVYFLAQALRWQLMIGMKFMSLITWAIKLLLWISTDRQRDYFSVR